jgi:TRAP-type C4-dicarboxylate transport system permease small subunit
MNGPGPPTSLPLRLLVIVGGGALLLAMAVDAIAVSGRHLGTPLLGSIEMVQVSVLVSAAIAMIIATISGTHAVVHLIVDRLSPGRRRFILAVNALLSAILFVAFLVGALWLAAETWSAYEESEVLRIPFLPLRITLVLSCAALAVIFLLQAIRGEGQNGES